jgi:hypothetical protein
VQKIENQVASRQLENNPLSVPDGNVRSQARAVATDEVGDTVEKAEEAKNCRSADTA